ncbi:conserved phage C-terminal domain-containing protein [Globicatella sanguinis]
MKEEHERKFQGIWIPKEVWLSEELNIMEKLFLVEIDSLDNEEGCYASNKYFSEFFDISKGRCSQIINSLKDKGLIEIAYIREGKEIKKRVIRVVNKLNRVVNKLNNPIKNIKGGYLENDKENNTLSNNTYINNTDNVLSSKHDSIPYREIVEYLNEKTGSKFKYTTQTTRTSIKTRFKEGYSLDDFKRVIDIKTGQWLYDQKMKPYLRPQTLFGTKFEAYLNEQPTTLKFEDSRNRKEREYSPEEIAEFEKAREQFDKYKRTYAQHQP